MAFNTSDAISATDVRNRVHDLVEEQLQFRAAFEQMPAPAGTNDSWDIPTDDDVLANPTEVSEGSSYPADEESFSTVTATRRKFGQTIPVTDEAEMDNAFPILARLTDKQARKMREKLDSEAFSQLDSNVAATDTPTSDGTLAYSDILSSKASHIDAGYTPDMLITDGNGFTDLLNDSDFKHATELGDEAVRAGVIQTASGMDIAVSNTGDVTNGHAYIIDTDFYGAEVVWSDMEAEQVDARLEDKTYLKIRTFRDWVTLDSGAARKIDVTV